MYFFRKFILTSILLTIAISTAVHAADYLEEEAFFSYKRFFLNQRIVYEISSNGMVEAELKGFIVNYTDGLYDISAGRLDAAKRHLLTARERWPEYFGTDFLLALVYEGKDNPSLAARHYKSYLEKLKKLQSGEYRISEPVIRSVAGRGIERYDDAYTFVEDRLARYGINIKKVKPVYQYPSFLIPIFVVILLIIIVLILVRKVLPYIELQERVSNPPEGFWVCKNCGHENPLLRMECEECGRVQE